jgi:hypothetical protein
MTGQFWKFFLIRTRVCSWVVEHRSKRNFFLFVARKNTANQPLHGHSYPANKNAGRPYPRITHRRQSQPSIPPPSSARKTSLPRTEFCFARQMFWNWADLTAQETKSPRSPKPTHLSSPKPKLGKSSPSAAPYPFPFPHLRRRPRSWPTPVTPALPTNRPRTPSSPSLYSTAWNHQTAHAAETLPGRDPGCTARSTQVHDDGGVPAAGGGDWFSERMHCPGQMRPACKLRPSPTSATSGLQQKPYPGSRRAAASRGADAAGLQALFFIDAG